MKMEARQTLGCPWVDYGEMQYCVERSSLTDASMGVVFTSMFALGVVLVKRYLSGIHFDAACVYEGLLQFVALNTVDVAGLEVPRTLLTIGPVLLMNILVIALFWKELKISSFDANLASAMEIIFLILPSSIIKAMASILSAASASAAGTPFVETASRGMWTAVVSGTSSMCPVS